VSRTTILRGGFAGSYKNPPRLQLERVVTSWGARGEKLGLQGHGAGSGVLALSRYWADGVGATGEAERAGADGVGEKATEIGMRRGVEEEQGFLTGGVHL
jgi:hypothetical protein